MFSVARLVVQPTDSVLVWGVLSPHSQDTKAQECSSEFFRLPGTVDATCECARLKVHTDGQQGHGTGQVTEKKGPIRCVGLSAAHVDHELSRRK